MAKYELKFVWKIKAPLEDVWSIVFNSLAWTNWWKSIMYVNETVKGFDTGEGSLRYYIIKGFLPHNIKYSCITTHVEQYSLIEGDIHGDIKGTIKWRFSEENEFTIIHGIWKVYDTKPLTYLASFLLYFIFKRNYKAIFSDGAKDLGRHLNTAVESSCL